MSSITIFDKLAAEYDQWFDRHPAVFESELAALKKVIPTTGKGLEVGVGSGRFAAALQIEFGLDPSNAMLAIAKSRGILTFKGVAESLPFDANTFDFILIVTTMCFVTDPLKTLEEAKRVLKSDGTLIIGMIDRNSRLGQTYGIDKQQNPYYRDACFYAVNEMLELLHKTDFKEEKIYQTIFSPIKDISIPEKIKPGYGEGGFVALKAVISKFHEDNKSIPSLG